MQVQYYPPFLPNDPAAALEENLRRAYPAPEDDSPEPLQDAIRRLKDKSGSIRPQRARHRA